jgi:hypothetical protein
MRLAPAHVNVKEPGGNNIGLATPRFIVILPLLLVNRHL